MNEEFENLYGNYNKLVVTKEGVLVYRHQKVNHTVAEYEVIGVSEKQTFTLRKLEKQ
jgi:hypothetical protein